MDEKINIEVIEKVKKFIEAKNKYYNEDKQAFRRSQNLQAGNGWFDRLGKAWGEARCSLTINPLKPVVDSTVNTFIRNPYKFPELPENINDKINECLYECLKDACNDGVGYFYIFHNEKNEIKFKRLDNLCVILCKENAIVINKIKGDRTQKLSTIWNDSLDALKLAEDEIPVLIFYEKTENSVKVYKIKNDKVEDETELQLSKIPIVAIKNKCVKINNEMHYRGYYYEFQDSVALMNACLSKSAEIAISRTPVALAEESLAGNEEYQTQWESNEPRNAYIYKSKMAITKPEGVVYENLPPPTFAPNVGDLDVLRSQIEALRNYIDYGTGSNLTSENSGNETATSVLLRRENKQAALSELLYNLQTATKEIIIILKEYEFILTGKQINITVIDNFQNSINNQRALDLILQMQSGAIPLPLQKALLELFSAPPEILQAIEISGTNPELIAAQQANEQSGQQIAILQNELNQARNLLTNAKTEAEIKYNTRIEEIKLNFELEKEKIVLEKMKLDLEYKKLGIDTAIETAKINNEAI